MLGYHGFKYFVGFRGLGSRLDLDLEMIYALIEAIRLSEKIKPSQDAKRRAFKKYGLIGSQRDPLLTAIFYGVMKRLGILDRVIEDIVDTNPYIIDPWLRSALRLLVEITHFRDPSRKTIKLLGKPVASFISNKTHPYNSIYYYRVYERIVNNEYRFKPVSIDDELMLKYMVPSWYAKKIIDLLGEDEAYRLFKAFNEIPLISIRVNTLKTNVERVVEELRKEGKKPIRSKVVDTVLKFRGPYNFEKSKLWRNGYIIVQEEASAYASILLDPKPGMTIVDLAAAPGGKTEHIGELMKNKGIIYAFDISSLRIKRMRELLRRTGIDIVEIFERDAREAPEILGYGIADRVLLDAPCSSDGTLARNPDLRWRLREERVFDLQELQKELLEAGWKLLRESGRLLYCTCSLLKEENEDVIKWFLEKYRDAELIPLNKPYDPGFLPGTMRVWPHKHNTIGFFYALIVKRSG
ncbi:MAG: Fmu (Sun) domain-containing protein [Desulfurococcales archaeon ex4484_58]|nr:MAG: Fmu (Sun) domain-containing protein [Desulfurococcales archaeon ex4484_58]